MNKIQPNNSLNEKSLTSSRIINISELEKLFKNDSKRGIIGSKNFGNTCYMNSAIACFSNTIELTTYFLTKQYKKDLNPDNKLGCNGQLASEWYNILKKYWIGNKKNGDPSKLKKIFSKYVKSFKGDEQQDIHEFITFFLDYLNEDLNKIKNKPYIEIDEQRNDEDDINCSKRFWDLHIKRNDSIITELFTGQYKSTIKCPKCNWISRTYDPFNTISLPIPDRKFAKNEIFNDIVIYFIPTFSMKNTLRINLNVQQDITYNELIEEIKKIEDFNYKLKSFNYMEVVEKECVKIPENDNILSTDNYTFLYEKDDEKCDIIIPLYFCKNSQSKGIEFSAFPRFLYVNKEMSFYEFQKKIFFFARKYIKLPIFEDESISEKNFEKIYSNNDNDYLDDEMIDLLKNIMEKEYNDILKNKNNKYEEYFKDFPYSLYIDSKIDDDSNNDSKSSKKKKKIKKFYLININDQNDITEQLNNISLENKITEIIKCCGENENNSEKFYLILEFNSKSKFVKKNQLKFNSSRKLEGRVKKHVSENYNNVITLFDCLEYFRTEETLEKGNEWYCKKCKELRLAKKKMEIFFLPKILIFCLKRFTNRGKHIIKNAQNVFFPIENLDMERFIVSPYKENCLYNLYAVSRHYGYMNGGHYTAVCKNIKGWFEYNDEQISRIDTDDIVNNNAYILFYKRVDD